ncbi:MAG: hypothetical protein QOJ98_851, partial [Acidobacteriota bacterium]|nr:hypothetical protein [Acidobacteriota bacterium]
MRRLQSLILLLLAVAPFALGQTAIPRLNEKCTVSVLNRNSLVRPDGSWLLPNIPANFGLIRARASCVENGRTLSGESEPFLLPPDGSVNVPPIALGVSTPIPSIMTVTATRQTLSTIGMTSQLTVIGIYEGNVSRNISANAQGTTYASSNPLIATVTAGGQVQAVSSGTVIVQATNEGAS